MNRRHLLLAGAAGIFGFSSMLPAFAANPAESFVSDNIQRGFDILNDRGTSAAERKTRFADFIVGLTDVKRVAIFLLGHYATTATPADTEAYVAAYQDYVQSTYQSYFALYAGQSLRVIDSRMRAPNDFVVRTSVTGGNAVPLEVDFRVRTDGAKPVLVDMAVAGVWLALAQRDQFTAVLARSNGDVKALTAHLRARQ
ncbi:MAG: ABC transporter substrate-binding protein [Pseudomonadota bacterium]